MMLLWKQLLQFTGCGILFCLFMMLLVFVTILASGNGTQSLLPKALYKVLLYI